MKNKIMFYDDSKLGKIAQTSMNLLTIGATVYSVGFLLWIFNVPKKIKEKFKKQKVKED